MNVPNANDMICDTICHDIYPSELTIECSNSVLNRSSFLDLDIFVQDGENYTINVGTFLSSFLVNKVFYSLKVIPQHWPSYTKRWNYDFTFFRAPTQSENTSHHTTA